MSVVTIEERGPVTIVSINRPQKLNAINKQVAIELQSAFTAFDRSAQRLAILTGAGGRAFSAGADVTDLPELWRCVPTVGVITEKPIIAAVAGWCIGGGLVMAMMCDLLVATESAKFSYPEGKVDLTGGVIAGLDEAIAMAQKFLGLAPLALATMKRFVTGHILPRGPAELAAGFGSELATVRDSEDAAEGVRAFKERRAPQYKGR